MPTRRDDDRGMITVWVLGMVLVVALVGWIAIGAWSTFAERRTLTAAADQAAQAGATALDLAAARRDNTRRLDPDEAEARAWDALARQGLDELTDATVTATADRVVVTLDAELDTGLLGVFAADDRPFRISATAIGTPRGTTP